MCREKRKGKSHLICICTNYKDNSKIKYYTDHIIFKFNLRYTNYFLSFSLFIFFTFS